MYLEVSMLYSTAEWAAKLVALGFDSEPLSNDWEEQLAKREAYKAEHGDCTFNKLPKVDDMGGWIIDQRVLKRKLDRGEPTCSGMLTAERAARRTMLGVVWQRLPASMELSSTALPMMLGLRLCIAMMLGLYIHTAWHHPIVKYIPCDFAAVVPDYRCGRCSSASI
jgi:hypothetical protein